MTGMMQRCVVHDYCAPSFYMVTVVTEPRRGCLSELHPEAGAAPGTEPGAASDARLILSPIGEIVRDAWLRTSSIYAGVEACEHMMMPDHFHGILWVKERLPRHMGHIVKAFKRVSTQECRSRGLLLPPNPSLPPNPGSVAAAATAAGLQSTLWQDGFQDSILLRKGQLAAMVNYIADNPRRLAAKRANPELFTVVSTQPVGRGRSCAAIGNHYLLDRPLKRQVQFSRTVSREELADRKQELLYTAAHGAVLVSPCISSGEKEVARAALDARMPLIVILENGFSPLYKPPGSYFEACAAGRLLMLAPFPYHREKRTITREQCQTLNEWAQAIVETGATI